MPDTPIVLDGNSKEFTISLPPAKKGEKERKIAVTSRKKSLTVTVKTETQSVEVPLGDGWNITIE